MTKPMLDSRRAEHERPDAGARRHSYSRRTHRRSGGVTLDGEQLDLRLDVRRHHPSGPDWGYYGTGPAQLALAILLAAGAERETAERHYQTFKNCCIARIRHRCWTLDLRDVRRWLESAAHSDFVFLDAQGQDRPPDSESRARRPSRRPLQSGSPPPFNLIMRLPLMRMRQDAIVAGNLERQS